MRLIRNHDLIELLKEYDTSWTITKNDETGAVLVNDIGTRIHGETLNAALLTALWIYRDERKEE